MTVLYADLEEKSQTMLPQSQTPQVPQPGAGGVQGAVNQAGVNQQVAAGAGAVGVHAQGLVGQQAQGQGPLRVGAYQGMGMAAM